MAGSAEPSKSRCCRRTSGPWDPTSSAASMISCSGYRIDVRRDRVRVAVAPEVGAGIFQRDPQHVWPLRCWFFRPSLPSIHVANQAKANDHHFRPLHHFESLDEVLCGEKLWRVDAIMILPLASYQLQHRNVPRGNGRFERSTVKPCCLTSANDPQPSHLLFLRGQPEPAWDGFTRKLTMHRGIDPKTDVLAAACLSILTHSTQPDSITITLADVGQPSRLVMPRLTQRKPGAGGCKGSPPPPIVFGELLSTTFNTRANFNISDSQRSPLSE